MLLLAPVALAGCKALPERPVRQTLYDFGLAPAASTATTAPMRPALILPEVEASGMLDTPSLLYRLGYEDPHQLRAYAFARWSTSPGQLVRQRLREVLALEQPVLDNAAAAALTRRGGTPPPTLRVELEEFSQWFDAPNASRGVLHLRCTLLNNTGGGERLVAQRSFEIEQPAPTPDAAGGVRALSAAVDTAARDLAAWLRQR
jgi:cholesterol transport system auxiliary component